MGQVRRPGGVAAPAADDQRPGRVTSACDLAYVVGGQVGGWVGGAALPAGAPVPDEGAVVGHDPAPSLPFLGVVVEVWSALALDLAAVSFLEGPAAGAPALAPDLAAAAEAGPDQAHRGLRHRRAARSRLQLSHRSPQAMRRL